MIRVIGAIRGYFYFRTGRARKESRVVDPVTAVTTSGDGDEIRITDCGGRPPVKNSVTRREITCPPFKVTAVLAVTVPPALIACSVTDAAVDRKSVV